MSRPEDDPIEALSAERDRAITDVCAEGSSLLHRMMKDFSMRPEEAAQAVLDFFSASFDNPEPCIHGRTINEHGWADCVECEAGDPDGTLPAEVLHDDDDYEVVELTVDLYVTILKTQDPEEYVRNVMSFRDTDGNNTVVTDVFRNNA